MINITFSGSGKDKFFTWNSFLVSAGSGSEKNPETISSRHAMDFLSEARGPYHENLVHNLQVVADLTEIASSSEIVRFPTTDYPNRVKFKGVYYNRGWIDSTGGRAWNFSDSRWEFDAQTRIGNVLWTASIRVNWSTFKCQTIAVSRWKLGTPSGTSVPYEKYTRSITAVSVPTFLVRPGTYSPEQIIAEAERIRQAAGLSEGTLSTGTFPLIAGVNDATYDENAALVVVGQTVLKILQTDSTLQEEDWGELAVQCSQNFNATSVNMLEFLRDVKHPTKIISQLRGLKRNLKDISGGYLAVKYGVLPTISDLKSIWKSMRSSKVFRDRNGFKTTSTGFLDSETVDDVQFELSQHIKLAIDTTEHDLKALQNALESYGVFPNASTVWELVPYSFVLDWFVNVGDYLEQNDKISHLQRFAVRYVTMSVKRTATVTLLPSSGYSGTVQLVDYWRRPQGHCPLPSTHLSTPLNVSGHWLEASALVIQRIK